MHNQVKIGVIIPALNEEEAIEKVVKDIPRNLIGEIVVVDNGSTDKTAEFAEKAGASVVYEPHRGYGNACLAGIKSIADAPPHIVVFMDGDYSDDPKEIEKLVSPIEKDGFDFVIGSRILGTREKGALPFYSIFANSLFAKLVHLLYGLSLTDVGSFKAIRHTSLISLEMEDKGYGFPIELVVKSAKKNLKVREVPLSFRKRIGTSKVTGNLFASVNAGIKILYLIFKYTLKRT
jgi:glycosyltransferase involved in cell wall biosynthesis